jgi:hypothetical protein
MGLLEQLNASGEPPAQQFRASAFFKDHPELVEQVRACRQAGFSWRQIATQISTDYQVHIGPTSLAEYLNGPR